MPVRITRNGIDFRYNDSGFGSAKASVNTIIGRSPFPYRNMIINGDFSIDQRNCEQICYYNTANTVQYTADRWALLCSQSRRIQAQVINDGPVANQQDWASGTYMYPDNTSGERVYSPKNFEKCIELKAETNYGSLLADDYFYFMQKIEGNFTKIAKFENYQGYPASRYILFSCWLKTNMSNANIDMFISNDFTSITSSNDRRYYRWLVDADSFPAQQWVRVHQLIPVDVGALGYYNWYNDHRTGLQLVFVLGAGSNYRSLASTYGSQAWHTTPAGGKPVFSNNLSFPSINLPGSVSNYLRITGVQLEYVDVLDSWESQPSSFEIRDRNLELSLCNRYYQKSYNRTTKPGSSGVGGYIWHRDHAYSTVQRYIPWRYNSGPMRAPPVLKYYGYNGTADAGYIAGLDYSGVNYGFIGEHSSMFWFSSTTTPSLPSHIDTLFHWTADAELY